MLAVLTACLLLPAISASAQNQLYKKYSSVPGITKVYISKAMFSLIGSSNREGSKMSVSTYGSDIDVNKYAKKLTGLYILSSEDPNVGTRLLADFGQMLKDMNLELLMEVEDDGDTVKMYSVKKGNITTDFFLSSHDSDGEITVMHLQGALTDDDIAGIMQSAGGN